MRTWFSAKASPDKGSADVAIYDDIGAFGVTAGDFRDALTALGDVKAIDLRLNSPGGDVFTGTAIHNMLARHPATVNVTVDGIAASIASLIAMAGDNVVMPENAMMMIHNPAGFVVGDAGDMLGMAEALNKIRDAMVTSYAAKSKLAPEVIAGMMDAETWLTAPEAVAHGFADKVGKRVQIAAKFDISKYKNPPRAAYDPDGDGDDDVLECLGYIGQAVDALADAVGCLTGTGDPDAGEATAPAALVAKAKMILANARASKTSDTGVGSQPTAGRTEEPTAEQPAAVDAQEISSLCLIAGMPEKTFAFLQSGKTAAEVRSELQALRADRGRGAGDVDVSARHAITGHEAQMEGWGKAIERINSRVGL